MDQWLNEKPPWSGKNDTSRQWVLGTATVKLSDQKKMGKLVPDDVHFTVPFVLPRSLLTPVRLERCKIERKWFDDTSWRDLQLGDWLCSLKIRDPVVKNSPLLTLVEGTGVDDIWSTWRSLVRSKHYTTTFFVVWLTCTRFSHQETPSINRHSLVYRSVRRFIGGISRRRFLKDFPTSVSPVSVYRSERRFMGGVSYTQSPVGGSRVGLSVGSSVCRRGFLSVSVYRWGFLTSLKTVCMLGKTRFETV